MDRNYIIKLCVAIYNVTTFFPSGEPLKSFLREKADDILRDAILFLDESGLTKKKEEKDNLGKAVIKNIAVIRGYLEVAKSQNWLKPVNFLIIGREYERIKEWIIDKSKEEADKKPVKAEEGIGGEKENEINVFNDRCREIMRILGEKEKIQIQELKNIFPNISKRTLRRDFDYLMARNFVEREGEGRETYYRIKPFKAILA